MNGKFTFETGSAFVVDDVVLDHHFVCRGIGGDVPVRVTLESMRDVVTGALVQCSIKPEVL